MTAVECAAPLQSGRGFCQCGRFLNNRAIPHLTLSPAEAAMEAAR